MDARCRSAPSRRRSGRRDALRARASSHLVRVRVRVRVRLRVRVRVRVRVSVLHRTAHVLLRDQEGVAPATVGAGGCNRRCWRLQPQVGVLGLRA